MAREMHSVDRGLEQELIAKVPIGAIFEHYKGKKYKVLEVGRHSETLGLCVVYQALYDSLEFGDHAVWIRPLEMFLEPVMVNGKEIPRFRLTHEDAP